MLEDKEGKRAWGREKKQKKIENSQMSCVVFFSQNLFIVYVFYWIFLIPRNSPKSEMARSKHKTKIMNESKIDAKTRLKNEKWQKICHQIE